jgi:hypothetical protein
VSKMRSLPAFPSCWYIKTNQSDRNLFYHLLGEGARQESKLKRSLRPRKRPTESNHVKKLHFIGGLVRLACDYPDGVPYLSPAKRRRGIEAMVRRVGEKVTRNELPWVFGENASGLSTPFPPTVHRSSAPFPRRLPRPSE